MKMFLKIFVISGVPFGAIIGLISSIDEGLEAGLVTGLTAAFFFGVAMSLTLGSLHKWKSRKWRSNDNIGPNQTGIIHLDTTADDAFDRCRDVLSLMGAVLKLEDKTEGRIEAEFGRSWKSFGESILVRVSSQSSDRSCVQVSSAPIVKTTLVDFGKGLENINRILHLLTKS